MKPQTMSPVQTNGMNSEMGILKSRPYNNPSDKTMIAMLAVSQKGPSNDRRQRCRMSFQPRLNHTRQSLKPPQVSSNTKRLRQIAEFSNEIAFVLRSIRVASKFSISKTLSFPNFFMRHARQKEHRFLMRLEQTSYMKKGTPSNCNQSLQAL